VTDEARRVIRAAYTTERVTVYQAYAAQIADAAVRAGAFVAPFSRDRMTWIKPSFGWMMHRSGWAAKPGQERVLAIEITRGGFEWALAHACLSHYEPGTHDSPQAWMAMRDASPVRVQWDPDRYRIADVSRDLPAEKAYPLSLALARRIAAHPGHPAPGHAAGGAR
jgi:hypothetical protein